MIDGVNVLSSTHGTRHVAHRKPDPAHGTNVAGDRLKSLLFIAATHELPRSICSQLSALTVCFSSKERVEAKKRSLRTAMGVAGMARSCAEVLWDTTETHTLLLPAVLLFCFSRSMLV